MPGLKDIGGGLQMADTSAPDPLELAGKQLGLIDLVNRVKTAPLEQATKEAELKLKQAQVNNIDVDQLIKLTEFKIKQNDEIRSQAKYSYDQINNIVNAFGQNEAMGNAILEASFPGSKSFANKDGSISVALNANGSVKPFTIDPRKVTDPKTLLSSEESLRKEWTSQGKIYNELDHNFNVIKSANVSTPSGAGDLAIVIGYMKLLDPGSVVRTSEGEAVQKTVNIPDQVWNLYQRQISNPNAPIFGGKNSTARKNIVDMAGKIFDSKRNDMVALGQSYEQIAKSSNLRPENILVPVGKLRFSDIVPRPDETNANANLLESPSIREPNKTSSANVNQQKQQSPQSNPSKTLDDLTTDWFNQTFTGGKR